MRTRALSLVFLPLVLFALGGCGEEGVADGATVTAYLAAPLCESAEQELAAAGPRAGNVRLALRCLPEAGGEDLAAIGANARRASEDASAIAYAEPAGVANRWGPPIVEAAGIAVFYTSSGQLAVERILRALRAAGDSGSLREAVAEELGVG